MPHFIRQIRVEYSTTVKGILGALDRETLRTNYKFEKKKFQHSIFALDNPDIAVFHSIKSMRRWQYVFSSSAYFASRDLVHETVLPIMSKGLNDIGHINPFAIDKPMESQQVEVELDNTICRSFVTTMHQNGFWFVFVHCIEVGLVIFTFDAIQKSDRDTRIICKSLIRVDVIRLSAV